MTRHVIPKRVPRVLSVGQCGYDNHNISLFFKRTFGAHVEVADTLDEALRALREDSFALALVNRVFDADGSMGLELIRAMKNEAEPKIAPTPVMLVSNYADVRLQAEELGALPGFGKAELIAPRAELIARLKAVLD